MIEVLLRERCWAPRFPPSDRACTILEAVREQGPITLAELVSNTQLNKNFVFYLLQALLERRILELDPSGRKYSLDVGLIELGTAPAERLTDVTIAKRHLAELLERLNVTFVIYQRASPSDALLVNKLERLSRLHITFGPDGGIRLVVAAVTFTTALTEELPREYGAELLVACRTIGTTIANVEGHIGVAS